MIGLHKLQFLIDVGILTYMCEQVAVCAQVTSSFQASSSIYWWQQGAGAEGGTRNHADVWAALTITLEGHVVMDSVAMPADAMRGGTLLIALGGMM